MFSERCRAHAAITLAMLLTSLAGGCYSGSDMAPVHGVVSVDGEPVAGAAIAFRPETGGRPAWAITEEDGTYQLQTIKPGDGALIGTHTVTITCFEEPSASAAGQADDEMASVFEADVRNPRKKWIVPKKFSDVETSGLSFEVRAEPGNEAKFEL